MSSKYFILLQSYSTCFGCTCTHHQDYRKIFTATGIVFTDKMEVVEGKSVQNITDNLQLPQASVAQEVRSITDICVQRIRHKYFTRLTLVCCGRIFGLLRVKNMFFFRWSLVVGRGAHWGNNSTVRKKHFCSQLFQTFRPFASHFEPPVQIFPHISTFLTLNMGSQHLFRHYSSMLQHAISRVFKWRWKTVLVTHIA
jgi:hypothetical protein